MEHLLEILFLKKIRELKKILKLILAWNSALRTRNNEVVGIDHDSNILDVKNWFFSQSRQDFYPTIRKFWKINEIAMIIELFSFMNSFIDSFAHSIHWWTEDE